VSEEKSESEQLARLIITPEEFGRDLYHKVWEQVIGPGINKANMALRTARAKPPSRLLHFMSAAGLEAILRTGILRLCRARASNDPLELEYGLEIARGIIRERELPAESPLERDLRRVMEAGTRGGWFSGKDHRPPEPHICCFAAPTEGPTPTEASTALWAMYGRNGAGFALVFDGGALSLSPLVDFFPVSYDPADQRAKLSAVIDLGRETAMSAHALALREATDVAARNFMGLAAHTFGAILAMHAAAMKAPRHDFEREWRMMGSYLAVEPVGEQLEFGIQASGPLLRTYFERSFPKSALLEVVVGAKHYDLNEFVVSAMLEHFKFKDTKVVEGQVNIRGADGT
jgi:hypothetical protein